MRLSSLSSLALLTGGLACGSPTAITQEEFTVQANGREVLLTNGSAEATFYYVVERKTAEDIRFLFALCATAPECRNVAPGSTVRVSYRDIIGYRSGSKAAVVYWYRAVQAPTGPRADSVRTTVTGL